MYQRHVPARGVSRSTSATSRQVFVGQLSKSDCPTSSKQRLGCLLTLTKASGTFVVTARSVDVLNSFKIVILLKLSEGKCSDFIVYNEKNSILCIDMSHSCHQP